MNMLTNNQVRCQGGSNYWIVIVIPILVLFQCIGSLKTLVEFPATPESNMETAPLEPSETSTQNASFQALPKLEIPNLGVPSSALVAPEFEPVTDKSLPHMIADKLMGASTNITYNSETDESDRESSEKSGNPPQELKFPFCVTWDNNMDEWWEHHVDWSVSKENDTHLCFSPLEDEEEASYLREVYMSQYIETCNNSTSIYKEMWSTGYGADIGNVVDGVEYGRRNKMSFNVFRRAPWMYAKDQCDTQDMRCYFLPFSSCWNKAVMAFNGNYFLNLYPRIKNYIKPYSYLLNYVARPKQSFRKEIYDYVKTNVPEIIGPVMCLHVRRSDVVLRTKMTRRYHAIKEYMDAAKKAVPDRFHQNVILFTDDQNAIEEAESNYPHHNWIYLNRTRHRGIEGGWEGQVPSKSPRLEVVILHSIFRLIKFCDVYVHSHSGIGFIFGSYAQNTTFHVNIDAELKKREIFREDHKVQRDQNFSFVPL